MEATKTAIETFKERLEVSLKKATKDLYSDESIQNLIRNELRRVEKALLSRTLGFEMDNWDHIRPVTVERTVLDQVTKKFKALAQPLIDNFELNLTDKEKADLMSKYRKVYLSTLKDTIVRQAEEDARSQVDKIARSIIGLPDSE